jgi:hypothetical protein
MSLVLRYFWYWSVSLILFIRYENKVFLVLIVVNQYQKLLLVLIDLCQSTQKISF